MFPNANTVECFRFCIGKSIVGVINKNDHKTLVFSDGTGLTISETGKYWVVAASGMQLMVAEFKQELETQLKESKGIFSAVPLPQNPSSLMPNRDAY